MRGFQILLGGIVVAGGCLYIWLLPQTKQEDLDVATAVAVAFLDSAMNEDSNSVVGLASRGYQQRILNVRPGVGGQPLYLITCGPGFSKRLSLCE